MKGKPLRSPHIDFVLTVKEVKVYVISRPIKFTIRAHHVDVSRMSEERIRLCWLITECKR